MTKFSILIATLFLFTSFTYGQTCNCEKNFEWVKKTFEENDAGFQYVIDQKGKTTYENHNKLFQQKIKNIKNLEECTKTLYDWLTFFRKEHLGVIKLENKNTDSPQITKPIVYKNWETIDTDIPEFEKYLNSKKEIDFEGVWETQLYKIGIKKIDNSYVGFIIETNSENWKVGQVKLKFSNEKGVFYLSDKSAEVCTNIKLIGRNYLKLGRFTLKRLSPKFETEKAVEIFFKSMSAEKPFLEELNKTTLLLRVPSFELSQKKAIDSIILANKDRILKTENLIIDLRNNGGGSDSSYKEILPFIYTNPIRNVGVMFLSTKLNNQRMLEYLKPEYGFDEKTKKWAKTSFQTLEKHLGEFVSLDSAKVNIEKLEIIYPFPKKIGIIINNGNASAAEQFLLAAKQSSKVKLFGTTTFGSLDISNMNYLNSPSGEFKLVFGVSKSYRIPDMTIDNKGIQPDYYMDNEIQEYNWIEYVNKILN